MNITLLTYGSRGDVQPFAALALGLQKAGHSPRLAAPHRFSDFAAQLGIPFTPLVGDPEQMSARLNDTRGSLLGAYRTLRDYAASIADQVVMGAFTACENADLIVHSFLFTTGGHSLARARGIPDISIQTFPMFAPTRAFPNVAMAGIPSGPLSALSHWMATQIFWHGGNMVFQKWRSIAPDLFNLELSWPFNGSRSLATPLVFAYSPAVLPQPRDWTAPHIHISGYLFLDTPETYQPPRELSAFLGAGDPPVCVTFGSMVNRDAGRIDRVVGAALAEKRQRAIILTGWGGKKTAAPAEDLLYLEGAPHDWLFPRCKAVIHHGGAGTTAAGLRAGIPNIVLPHAVDQPFWGKRVAAIGVGPAPLDLKKLSVRSLAAALEQIEDPALRARAAEIGRIICAEDGVGEAVRIIEQHAAATRRQAP